METSIDEIADGIVRFSTVLPHRGLNVNQFLIDAEEPLLFHCGHRHTFLDVSAAVRRYLPLARLRWISFGHVEADEVGALNLWLAVAPQARVVHSPFGCDLSIDDLSDRPPLRLGHRRRLELGGRRVQLLETPHLPHGLDAVMLYEEVTGTLLCGDLLSNTHLDRAVVVDDLIERAGQFEAAHPASVVLTPSAPVALRGLAELAPRRLAVMHGASFRGDGAWQLTRLADAYEHRLAAH